jgi:hypothetical protein
MAKKPATDWGSVARSAQERAHSAEIGDLKRQLGNYQQLVSELEAQLDVASAIGSRKLSKKALKPVTLDQGEAVAVLCASDWHVEETVTSASTNGLNEFNLGIAEDRIRKFFTSAVRLTEIQRGGCKIEQAVLWLGGDLMSGFIHEELQETNELTPTETILWLKDQLAEGIAYLRQQFSSISIVCNYGNHGRTTKKPRHATGYKNSYEWLLYSILSSQITGDDLEWVVADSYLSFVPVYDRVIRFHHGDGLKYQGGIGGLTIPTEKAIASWNRAKVADLDVFGHWHTQQQNPKWVSNGSLIGYNAYAVSIKAGYERPQQTFFLFDRDRGRTITAPIIL